MKVGRVDETCRHYVLLLFARLKPQPAWVDPVAYHVFSCFSWFRGGCLSCWYFETKGSGDVPDLLHVSVYLSICFVI